ncbi:MAG: hypothetical protein PHW04_17525, partial [Candidatus Wallbacteria bacterium]|nr:hypothetical protein [Candidatus Wallbacteria bacterium]
MRNLEARGHMASRRFWIVLGIIVLVFGTVKPYLFFYDENYGRSLKNRISDRFQENIQRLKRINPKYRKDADRKSCVANMRTLESALEMYLMENGGTPPVSVEGCEPGSGLLAYICGSRALRCPEKGRYLISSDSNGYYVFCTVHGSVDSENKFEPEKLPALVRALYLYNTETSRECSNEIRSLIDSGADMNAADVSGRTPLILSL